jgi:hypothetical protein
VIEKLAVLQKGVDKLTTGNIDKDLQLKYDNSVLENEKLRAENKRLVAIEEQLNNIKSSLSVVRYCFLYFTYLKPKYILVMTIYLLCSMNNNLLLTYLFAFSQIGSPQSPSYTPSKRRNISYDDSPEPIKRGPGRPRGRGRGRGRGYV